MLEIGFFLSHLLHSSMLLLGATGSINCTHWESGRPSCQAFEVARSLKQWIFNDPPPPIMLEVVVYENNKSINALNKKKIDSLWKGWMLK